MKYISSTVSAGPTKQSSNNFIIGFFLGTEVAAGREMHPEGRAGKIVLGSEGVETEIVMSNSEVEDAGRVALSSEADTCSLCR